MWVGSAGLGCVEQITARHVWINPCVTDGPERALLHHSCYCLSMYVLFFAAEYNHSKPNLCVFCCSCSVVHQFSKMFCFQSIDMLPQLILTQTFAQCKLATNSIEEGLAVILHWFAQNEKKNMDEAVVGDMWAVWCCFSLFLASHCSAFLFRFFHLQLHMPDNWSARFQTWAELLWLATHKTGKVLSVCYDLGFVVDFKMKGQQALVM